MKISLNWLKEYIDLSGIQEKELLERLTLSSCEVEDVVHVGEHLNDKVVVGEIVGIEQHPNAEKLKVCDINVSKLASDQVIKIVCGGTNVVVGAKVVVALPGARVKWHGEDAWTELKEAEIRGVESVGMICAAEELEIAWRYSDNDGQRPIMVLPEDAPVGELLSTYLGLDDTVLTIDNKSITHRVDLFSHVGIATELGAIFKRDVKDTRYNELVGARLIAPVPPSADEREIVVHIEAHDAVKRYSALRIRNVHVTSSPRWMQNRLRAVGIRPINNLVDATNYVMMEFGMPLHAFDADTIGKGTKTIRCARAEETVTTLDGSEHVLTSETLVAVDGDGVAIDLPGIMGGQKSEVRSGTKSILLQAAVFDRVVIRTMSRILGHRTDASGLYERGIDPNLTLAALQRVTELLRETCPAATVTQYIDEYPKPVVSRTIEFDPQSIQKQLGAEISEKESRDILERLGFGISNTGAMNRARTDWIINIPPRRKDIFGFQDICEEVGRIVGYDRITAREHTAPLRTPVVPREITARECVRDVLTKYGFHEVYQYIFVSERDLQLLSLDPASVIRVQNPISEELKYLRTSLLSSFLHTLEVNQGNHEAFSFYESGKVFSLPVQEEERIGWASVGSAIGEEGFRRQVGYAEAMFHALKVGGDIVRAPFDHAKEQCAAYQWLVPGESITFVREGRTLGILGRVQKKVCDAFGVKRPVWYAEYALGALAAARDDSWNYVQLPQFPSVLRDVSVVADETCSYAQIAGVLSESPYIASVSLFDVFTGKGVAEGKKSLAFHLEFRSPDRTLTSKEIDQSLAMALQKLAALGVVLRV